MALDSRSKVRLVWVGAACAPIVAVQAVRMFSGTGPHDAAAAIIIPEPAVAAPATQSPQPGPISAEQRSAMAWLSSRAAQSTPVRSPMLVVLPPIQPVQTPAAPEDPGLPKLRLGGVASRGKNVIASINNRLFAVGDEPAQGWTIAAIDASNRSVTMHRYDGKRIELSSAGMKELPGGE